MHDDPEYYKNVIRLTVCDKIIINNYIKWFYKNEKLFFNN